MDPSTFYIFIFVCTPQYRESWPSPTIRMFPTVCEVDQLWKENRTLSRSLLGHLIIIQLSFIQVKTILDDICVKEMLCELLNSLLAWILFSYNGNESFATNLEIYTIFKKRKRWKKKRTQQDFRIFRRFRVCCIYVVCSRLFCWLLTATSRHLPQLSSLPLLPQWMLPMPQRPWKSSTTTMEWMRMRIELVIWHFPITHGHTAASSTRV